MMVKLSSQEVKHIAKLANISLKPSEVGKFKGQLSRVIDYVKELSKIDVKNIKPTSQTTNLENIEREDKINTNQVFKQEETLSNSENTSNGYFKVKGILEKE